MNQNVMNKRYTIMNTEKLSGCNKNQVCPLYVMLFYGEYIIVL